MKKLMLKEKMNMKNITIKYGLSIALLFLSNLSYAGYGGGKIDRFYVSSDGLTRFGLVTQLDGTCSNWGEHFKFDASTPIGKNLLSVIMSAKAANQTVNVWYLDSPKSGTNQTNGCTTSEMADLTAIGIK